MIYDEFVDQISLTLQKKLGENEDRIRFYPKGYKPENKADLLLVRRINEAYYEKSDVLQGDMLALVKEAREGLVCVPVPVELYYDFYKSSDFSAERWDKIMDAIDFMVGTHLQAEGKFRLQNFLHTLGTYENEKDKLFLKAELNVPEEDIEEYVCRTYGDYTLFLTLNMTSNDDEEGKLSFGNCPKKQLHKWGVTAEEAFEVAFKNMLQIFEPVILLDKERCYLMEDDSLQLKDYFIMTTSYGILGSSVLFCPGVAERLYKALGNKPFLFYSNSDNVVFGFEDSEAVRESSSQLIKLVNKIDGKDEYIDVMNVFDGHEFKKLEKNDEP